MMVDKIEIAGLATTILVLVVFLICITETTFPSFQYATQSNQLIDASKPIGAKVSTFMWQYRSIDLIAQVVVMFVASAGCLAILRIEKEKGAGQ
jgi:multisubunit Na+/H+ antiporter MnhB subunit